MIRKCFLCVCLTISTFAFTARYSDSQFYSIFGSKSYNKVFGQEITRLIGVDLAKALLRAKREIEYVDEYGLKNCPEHHNTASESDRAVIERYGQLMKTDKHYCSFVVYDYKPFYKFGEQDYNDFNLDIRTALSCGVYASGLCIMCPQTCSQFCYDLCSVSNSYPSDNTVLRMIRKNMYIRGTLRYKTKEERELELNSNKFCDFGLSDDIKGYICFALHYTYHCGFWGCDFLQTFIWLFAALGDDCNKTEMSIINNIGNEGYDLVFTRVPWIVSNANMTNAQRFLVAMFGSIASSYASKYRIDYPLARIGKRTSYLYSIWLSYSKLPQWSVIALLGHEFDFFARSEQIESQLKLENGFMVLRNVHTKDCIKEDKPGEFFLSQKQLFDTIKSKKSEIGYCENDIAMHDLLNIYITDCERELREIGTNMTNRIQALELLKKNEIKRIALEFVKETRNRFNKIEKNTQIYDNVFCESGFHSSFYDCERISKLILEDECAFNTILKPRVNMIFNYIDFIAGIDDLEYATYDMLLFGNISVEKFVSMKEEYFIFLARRAMYCNYLEPCWLYAFQEGKVSVSDKDRDEIYRISHATVNDEEFLPKIRTYIIKFDSIKRNAEGSDNPYIRILDSSY